MNIPASTQTTIAAIYEHYEKKQSGSFRAHLGGSIIGRPCDRHLWYSFHWCLLRKHDGRLLRLFETGHLAEPRFVENLRSTGVTVHEVDVATGRQFRVNACNGHFGGSMDGVGLGFIEAPMTWHLIEMKTHNQKSFDQLVKKGVREAKPEHFIQMQVYMYLAEPQLTRAYYLAVNKNTDELYGERVKLDNDIAEATIERANAVIASDRPLNRISEDPSWYQCKLCEHHPICHGQEVPDVNCRTCLHSSPVDNGNWHCDRFDQPISGARQRVGCDSHLFNPYLLEKFAEPIDSGEYWIQYALKSTGELFITGEAPEQMSSGEIKIISSKELLADKNVQSLKTDLDATIVK